MNKELTSQILKLKMNLDKDVSLELEKESNKLLVKINDLKKINVKNVEPMARISDIPIKWMRDDIPQNTFSKQDFLENAKNHDENFIVIKKDVKND